MRDDSFYPKASRAPKPASPRTGLRTGGKPERRGHRMTGRIVKIVRGQGHGFIRDEGGRTVFFHRSDVPNSRFNDLAVDDHIACEVLEDDVTGPRATLVRKKRPKAAPRRHP